MVSEGIIALVISKVAVCHGFGLDYSEMRF